MIVVIAILAALCLFLVYLVHYRLKVERVALREIWSLNDRAKQYVIRVINDERVTIAEQHKDDQALISQLEEDGWVFRWAYGSLGPDFKAQYFVSALKPE